MKFLVEFNPPIDMKNDMEKSPELQKKVGEAIERMKPLAAWFTLRYGFFVVDVNSYDELTRKRLYSTYSKATRKYHRHLV